jgi:cysteinyl-tRNA synthetase
LEEWQFGNSTAGFIPFRIGRLEGLGGDPGLVQPQFIQPHTELSEVQIEQQIAERLDAKKKKNFAQADEIRKSLASHGILIEDKPDGTSRWKR